MPCRKSELVMHVANGVNAEFGGWVPWWWGCEVVGC